MQLHEKICLFRKVKGWTQEEMAEKLGMSEHGYSDIERGKTDLQVSRLQQIANAFEIEVSDLFAMNEKAAFNLACNWHDNRKKTIICTHLP